MPPGVVLDLPGLCRQRVKVGIHISDSSVGISMLSPMMGWCWRFGRWPTEGTCNVAWDLNRGGMCFYSQSFDFICDEGSRKREGKFALVPFIFEPDPLTLISW